jgi:hypothetical protein
MKALSICGIVVLHAIFIQNGIDNEISTILRLIAIKVLLFLSGYVVYGKIKSGWILEKIVRRLPLLIIFTGLYFLFARYVVGIDGGEKLSGSIFNWYIYNIAIGFNGLVIWYVWVIMICYVILGVFERYTTKLKIPYLLKIGILALIIVAIPYNYFGFNLIRWYGLFMLLGYSFGYVVQKFNVKRFGKLAYLSIPLLPLVIFLVGSELTFKGQWASSGYIDIIRAIASGEAKYIFIFSTITLIGIAFVYCVSKLITLSKLAKPFIFVGGSTIGILLLHKPFLELKLLDNYWLSAIIALSLSLGLYQLLKRVRILDYSLFGGTDIPIKISNKLEGWYGKE